MSALEFHPARREAIHLLLGVAGGTGSGKTYSALRLARGLAGSEPFGLIDTENRRALMYADEFQFEHADFGPPFTPARYLEAIQKAAERFSVIVVDSASHEWAGEGGVLDMADAEFERRGGKESARMASWIAPKAEHKRFVRELLRLPAHVILALRAEPKVEMTKGSGGWEVKPKQTLPGGSRDGWIPIADSRLPFELTCSFLLMSDRPGVPLPIKLPGELGPFVALDAPLSEQTGAAIGSWAAGSGTPAPSDDASPVRASSDTHAEPESPPVRRADGEILRELMDLRAQIGDALSDEKVTKGVYGDGAETRRWTVLLEELTLEQAIALKARLSAYLKKMQDREEART